MSDKTESVVRELRFETYFDEDGRPRRRKRLVTVLLHGPDGSVGGLKPLMVNFLLDLPDIFAMPSPKAHMALEEIAAAIANILQPEADHG